MTDNSELDTLFFRYQALQCPITNVQTFESFRSKSLVKLSQLNSLMP